MSISRINALKIHNLFAAPQSKDHPEGEDDGLIFKEILNKSKTRTPDGPLDRLPPLSKKELMEILNTVHSQMNSHLLRVFSSDNKDDVDIRVTSLLDRLLPPDLEMSKKHHSNQKTDVLNGGGELESIITKAAHVHGVDPALIKSVIKVESNFNPNSTSPKGAMGLMQLMPGTAKDLGVQNAYDPVENIQAGTRYLKMLMNRYDGNIHMTLAAYNWGMGNLEKRPAQMPSETKNYIENVTRHYGRAKG